MLLYAGVPIRCFFRAFFPPAGQLSRCALNYAARGRLTARIDLCQHVACTSVERLRAQRQATRARRACELKHPLEGRLIRLTRVERRGMARAKPAPAPCWRRPVERPAQVCPTNSGTSPQRPHSEEREALAATGHARTGARSGHPASFAIPAPPDLRAQDHELLKPHAAKLWVSGAFAAFGHPEHGAVRLSGARLWMPCPHEW